ncbi:MAG TPA: D-glycero-beta-D-manno-heptose 1-phosphate adenylyltransferase [Syntrophales bacterium]|jgi:D-beta-D-heptose 7-phosphate kinase/D-beta-D-heptose 1-phosphate adenosyltransferase|nr:D-glycero-beta-D-manno-heptose 1-phosphate adenylyltransferase [Syntrophales bacterium]HRT61762.1 D-glycero-beta-D-manno-heptose 1-phosphate adenylyltransferase [Syntrophales bacterium]
MGRILSRVELKKEVEKLKQAGKKIVFTNGCFDILHTGHTRYLREARKLGDVLVLGLNSDDSIRSIKGEKRPIVPEAERADVLSSLESVDYLTIFNELTPLELIELLKPDVLVKGGNWAEKDIVGGDAVRKWGGTVAVIPEIKGASTTNIIEKIMQVYGGRK